ncbi:MAG: cupin domain-containing protein [Candidatus Doudnabacteria bacterium]|nr:cupin domain-containing protein [Candidatus Doudnabacteria bacterium]
MNEQEIIEQLKSEGFNEVEVYEDKPNFEYAEHTHEKAGIHVILRGEMTLTEKSGSKTYKAGETINIPSGTAHSAKMGPDGCRYAVGEK